MGTKQLIFIMSHLRKKTCISVSYERKGSLNYIVLPSDVCSVFWLSLGLRWSNGGTWIVIGKIFQIYTTSTKTTLAESSPNMLIKANHDTSANLDNLFLYGRPFSKTDITSSNNVQMKRFKMFWKSYSDSYNYHEDHKCQIIL